MLIADFVEVIPDTGDIITINNIILIVSYNFVFSYLSGRISFTDIANLKSENIVEGRVKYIRKKTGKEISL